MIAISFVSFLLLFVGIGVASSIKAKKNNADYLLAGHDIPPWMAALSAVATNNSGYMFIGMIGFTYMAGLQSIWLMIGWILGDYVISIFVHKKLRMASEDKNLLSFGGVLSRWHGTDFRKLRFIVGLITVVFLGIYAAAQFKAGSKAMHVLLGWDMKTGAIIGSVIVFAYSLSGGIRASIWTDAAQSFVMFFAMGLLFFMGVNSVGGFSEFWTSLGAVSDTYLGLQPTGMAVEGLSGTTLFIVGWFFAGFGVIGQPHIMIRFMTIDDPESMKKTRAYYYAWFTVFYALTIGVGLVARLVFPDANSFDPELALPMMSQSMLPKVLVGVVLAGIFSATMSTADSQILSCSASCTRDILPRTNKLWITKAATALVCISALFIALYGPSSVFELVLISWSILSAAFGPLLFLYSLDKKVTEPTAIAMVLVGVGTTLLWRFFGLDNVIYEVGPGILAGLITYWVLSLTPVNAFNSMSEEKLKVATK